MNLKNKTLILLAVFLAGCICGGATPRNKPQPMLVIYDESVKLTTTSTSTTTTSTTTTIEATTTALESTTSTTSTTTTTIYNWAGVTTSTLVKAPVIDIPEGYNTCIKDGDCMLVTDCCGNIGRQYAINTEYRMRWYDRLGCYNTTYQCITNLQLMLNRQKYSICEDKTCQKAHEAPENKSLAN